MSRSKKLYVLLGILAVICIVTFAVSRYETKKEEIRTSDETVLSIVADEVTALSWSNESGDYTFTKDGEVWIYAGDADFPVSTDRIHEQLAVFEDFQAAFTIENAEDISQYGLDDPVGSIHITAGETVYDIDLGDYSTMDQQRYVSMGDGNVYLAAHDPMDEYALISDDMIADDETPARLDEVSAITFAGKEAYSVSYTEESTDSYLEDDVYFASIDGRTLPLDTDLVEDYLEAVEDLELSDFVNYKVTDEELAGYGLDNPEVSVTIIYTAEDEEGEDEELSFTLHISRDPEEAAAEDAKAEEEDTADDEEDSDEEETITAYARVGESPIVYSIDADSYEILAAAGYNDLRHKKAVTVGLSDISSIDIVLEDESYTLVRDSEPDDDNKYGVWSYNGTEIESVSGLNSAVSGISAEEFTADSPDGREEISLLFHLDNENFPEVSVDLYRVDGSSCLALVNGESFAYVARSAVVELIEAVNAIVLQ